MANRVATAGDESAYATVSNGALKEGDVIIDTTTNSVDGKGYFYNATVATTFSGMRTSGNIWMFSSIGEIGAFALINGDPATSTFIKGASGAPVTLRFLSDDGNPPKIIATPSINDVIRFGDIDYFAVDFEMPNKPGLKWGITEPFMKDHFGYELNRADSQSNATGQLLRIDAATDLGTKEIAIRGLYAKDGFTSLRIIASNLDLILDELLIERCFVGQTIGGEAIYTLMTNVGATMPRAKNCIVRDNYMVMTSYDGSQFEHMLDNADITNNVIYLAAAGWKGPSLGAAHRNGIQLFLLKDGFFRNNIIAGAGETGMIIQGDDNYGVSGGTVELRNNLFTHLRGRGQLGDANLISGVNYKYVGNDFINWNDTLEESGETQPTEIFNIGFGSDEHQIYNTRYHSGRSTYMSGSNGFSINKEQDNTIENADFINTGLGDDPEKIELWYQVWAAYAPESGNAIDYSIGDITRDPNDGNYYMSKTNHSAIANSPKDDSTNWRVMVWDSQGVESLETSYNGTPYSYEPPYILGLLKNNEHNKLNRGTFNQENNTSTIIRWWIADDANGTNKKKIPNATTVDLDETRFSQIEVGKYLGGSVIFKKATGGWYKETFTVFQEIT